MLKVEKWEEANYWNNHTKPPHTQKETRQVSNTKQQMKSLMFTYETRCAIATAAAVAVLIVVEFFYRRKSINTKREL